MIATGTVLIIDDEMDSCLIWTSFLSQLKFTVYTAQTLKEGMRLIDVVRPEIIFLDNNLPDGLGWEQVDVIKSKLPGCKINLVSAYHFDETRWSHSDVRIIEKPITLSSVKRLLI
jgi:two-component system, OmpR family, response regulator